MSRPSYLQQKVNGKAAFPDVRQACDKCHRPRLQTEAPPHLLGADGGGGCQGRRGAALGTASLPPGQTPGPQGVGLQKKDAAHLALRTPRAEKCREEEGGSHRKGREVAEVHGAERTASSQDMPGLVAGIRVPDPRVSPTPQLHHIPTPPAPPPTPAPSPAPPPTPAPPAPLLTPANPPPLAPPPTLGQPPAAPPLTQALAPTPSSTTPPAAPPFKSLPSSITHSGSPSSSTTDRRAVETTDAVGIIVVTIITPHTPWQSIAGSPSQACSPPCQQGMAGGLTLDTVLKLSLRFPPRG